MDVVSRAADFLSANGRDVERALFDHHFGTLALDGLLGVLARYQNPDGGFGRELEVDIQSPVSNPFATELALQFCRECEVPGDHPLLQRTVAYLEQSQTEEGDWRFTTKVYESELAPWFRGWQFPNLNPGCTTAGLLRDLGLGSPRLHDRAEVLFQSKKRVEDVTSGDFYSVRPYAFYFLPESSHPERELWISGILWWHVDQHVASSLADNGHFFEYVRGPETYIGRNLPRDIVEAHLDGLVAEIADDGGWPSPYSPRWRAWSTVQNLIVLKSFGRV